MFDLTKDPDVPGHGSPDDEDGGAGGVWFAAPGSEHYNVSEDSFSGVYDTGTQYPSIVQWTVHKVE